MNYPVIICIFIFVALLFIFPVIMAYAIGIILLLGLYIGILIINNEKT